MTTLLEQLNAKPRELAFFCTSLVGHWGIVVLSWRMEIIFVVEDAPEGGYTARALGESIFTEADDLDALRTNVVEAVQCHYEGRADGPKLIRLHFHKEEILPA